MKIFIIGLISISLLYSCSKPSNNSPNPSPNPPNRDSPTLYNPKTIDSAQKIFITTDSAVMCYNAQNGNEIWKTYISYTFSIGRALAYHKGNIYCQSDSALTCLDTTGKILWRYEAHDQL